MGTVSLDAVAQGTVLCPERGDLAASSHWGNLPGPRTLLGGEGWALGQKCLGALLIAIPASSPDWGLHGDPEPVWVGVHSCLPPALPSTPEHETFHLAFCVPRAQRPAAFTAEGQ